MISPKAFDEAVSKAREIVSRMTASEMCSQLLHSSPAIPRLGIAEYNWWNEGLHGAARSGTATVFPQAIGLAAAFDVPLMRSIGDIVSTEQRAKYNTLSKLGDRGIYKGLTVWSPNINIFRDPRWGRGQETYGEDPYLTSRLAVAFIKGLQGDDENHRGPVDLAHIAELTIDQQQTCQSEQKLQRRHDIFFIFHIKITDIFPHYKQ